MLFAPYVKQNRNIQFASYYPCYSSIKINMAVYFTFRNIKHSFGGESIKTPSVHGSRTIISMRCFGLCPHIRIDPSKSDRDKRNNSTQPVRLNSNTGLNESVYLDWLYFQSWTPKGVIASTCSQSLLSHTHIHEVDLSTYIKDAALSLM